MTCIKQVFDNTSLLQAAGRADGQNSFHVSGAPFALGAEAAFAPQDGLPYCSFGQIIRRLQANILDKCPQIVSLVNDTANALLSAAFSASPSGKLNEHAGQVRGCRLGRIPRRYRPTGRCGPEPRVL